MLAVEKSRAAIINGDVIWRLDGSNCIQATRKCLKDGACVAIKCRIPSGRARGFSSVYGFGDLDDRNTVLYVFK